jgi:dolichyl-diphosphooligosaccharide--protein glycosyltransferase
MAKKGSFLGSAAYAAVAGLYIVIFCQLLFRACGDAFKIRMKAIEEFGRIIHEFDPYFNYRAAEYLWEHGWRKFFHWFDYLSWYPLGRPVGTTIYPGMQFTSMWIKMFLLPDWSINDICCLIPAWFGVSATLATAAVCYVSVDSIKSSESSSKSLLQDIPFVAFLTEKIIIPIIRAFEKLLKTLTGSNWGMPSFKNPPALESAVFTACIMSVVPAHLMRSIGGGYDNESVATTAMQVTFWFWVWTLASPNFPVLLGILTGLAYFYMVASWGGYIFVINLIGVHALIVFLLQKLPWDHLYKSYTSFYIVGTFLAMQIPVVGWTPIRSLEQMGPLGVFIGFQGLQIMSMLEKRKKNVNKWKIRSYVVLAGILVALPVVYYLYGIGYVGPISSRVRGLFVEHTKTGNPLVDSVAEHQAASPQAYEQYLDMAADLAPFGFGLIALFGCTASSSFLVTYGMAAYFFSHKMVRLILLTAPIASICGGIALGYGWAWAMGAIFGDLRPSIHNILAEEEEAVAPEEKTNKPGNLKKKKKKKNATDAADATESSSGVEAKERSGDPIWTRIVRLLVAYWAVQQLIPRYKSFQDKAEHMSQALSHPTIILKHGDHVIDDYRQAYFWLRDNTPEDARIMAWWDYGYQITGIANRTTIADGNTWNHEHIALLGRILTGPLKEAHRITRHLADYVLVWAGGGGDDVAKSPHLRRIANSVYRGLCREPTCRDFGFYVSNMLQCCLLAS